MQGADARMEMGGCAGAHPRMAWIYCKGSEPLIEVVVNGISELFGASERGRRSITYVAFGT